MEIDCPHGWKNTSNLGHIIIEDTRVNIFDNLCDCPDLCGITTCEYYDISREATRRYNQASAYAHTLQGHRDEEARKEEYERQRRVKKSSRPSPLSAKIIELTDP